MRKMDWKIGLKFEKFDIFRLFWQARKYPEYNLLSRNFWSILDQIKTLSLTNSFGVRKYTVPTLLAYTGDK